MEPRPGDERAGALRPSYCVGLDLGQSADYTALSVGEIAPPHCVDGVTSPFSLAVRHLERFKLHTPYPEMVSSVAARVGQIKALGRCILVVDATGVGRPVVDLFRSAGLGVVLWPVTIATSAMGQARRDPSGEWTVPKRDLIGALVALAHGGRLAVSDRLPEARTFQEELRNFRMRITADANLTYGAWREGAHDDLVLSVALACWAANRWASPGGLV